MSENEEKFLNFYMEQTSEEMRHIENLREKVTLLVVTVSSAIAGFVIQQKYASETKPLVWFIILLGLFGLVMILKMYQLHQMDQKRLDKWYVYYKEGCGPDAKILELRDDADRESAKRFKWIAKIKHNHFWSAIHLFVIMAGIYLLAVFPSSKPINSVTHNNPPIKKQVEQAAVNKDIHK